MQYCMLTPSVPLSLYKKHHTSKQFTLNIHSHSSRWTKKTKTGISAQALNWV
jgi:hypothetical protein